MDREGVDILWVGGQNMDGGSKSHGLVGQNPMVRGVKIPWVGGSKYHG